jgi:glutathione S-transferase
MPDREGADAMIQLYHCVSARSFRGLWILEELGLGYELVMLPFPPRQYARHFLAVNPLGTIPLLVHGDTRMTESAAICQYLCSLKRPTPMQVEPGEPLVSSVGISRVVAQFRVGVKTQRQPARST